MRYGKGEHNRFFRERYGLHRLALHAAGLAFEEPGTATRVTVRVPPTGSLRRCLAELGLLEAAERALS